MRTGRPHHTIKRSGIIGPSWHDLHETYPRSATLLAVAIVLLLLANLTLIYQHYDYYREQPRLREAALQAESLRSAALESTEQNLAVTRMYLGRREALLAREPHLAVDCSRGLIYLQRERAVLREMAAVVGPGLTEPPGAAPLRVPLKRSLKVVQILEGDYAYQLPESLFLALRQPVPEYRTVPGAFGPLALLLEGGAVIYSTPVQGPLADEHQLLPRGLRVATADLEAIRETLHPGMRVYFY